MKVAIWTMIIGIGLPASSVAQVCVEVVKPPTKLEAFMATDGAVVIRGSSRVGAVRGEPGALVAVASKEFTNVRTGERAHGITVEVRKAKGREPGGITYVDFDEMASFLSGLEYLVKVDKSSTSLDQVEAGYRTKGGLIVAMYNTSAGLKAAVSSGIGGTATAELEYGNFVRFRELLQSAYARLRSMRSGEE